MTAPASAQPPAGAEPPPGPQPTAAAQPPPGAQPTAAAQPPPGAQPTAAAQPPPGAQPTAAAQPPPSAQPTAAAQPPASGQPPPGPQPTAAAQPPASGQPPPSARLAAGTQPAVSGQPPAVAHESLQGRYAGFVSRFVAFFADLGASVGVFLLALAAAQLAATVVTAHQVSWNRTNIVVLILLAIWEFIYFAYSWGANGKTFGMALLGIRVVRRDGGEVSRRQAVIRTLALPLSFLFLGLGFLGILFGDQRRALHDVIADTAVVYAWNARAARLRFLARDSGHQRPRGGAARR